MMAGVYYTEGSHMIMKSHRAVIFCFLKTDTLACSIIVTRNIIKITAGRSNLKIGELCLCESRLQLLPSPGMSII